MGSGEEDSIEAAAAARRERLKALREAQELLNTPDENNGDISKDTDDKQDEEDQDQEEADMKNVKFRNYLPHDKQLQEGKLAPPTLPKFDELVVTEPPKEEEKKEDPFLNIAPKKPNWDLRRDVQKKLDKLERRTQKAMLILMEQEAKRRAESEENGED